MYALKEAVKGMVQTRSMTLVTIVTITVALFILGLLAGLTLFGHSFVNSIMKSEKINVYVKDDMSDADLLILDSLIESMDEVESTRIISKEDAARELEKMFKNDLLTGLGSNPLPRSIVVTMASGYRMSDDLQRVAARIRTHDGLESVEFGHEWMSKMDFIFLAFLLGEMILFIIISSSCLLIISNTISLTVLSRKETIEIMRLVGATDSFISRPFYYEGFLQGLVSGMCAFCFLYGGYMWVRYMVPDLDLYFFMFQIHTVTFLSHRVMMLLIIPVGGIMGLVGSMFAVRGAV